jgi:hypothetical protein
LDVSWDGYGILVVNDQNDPSTEGVDSLVKSSPASGVRGVFPNDHNIKSRKLIPPLLPHTPWNRVSHNPPKIVFPLSADHCLITLVQYNVVRAIMFNMTILSILDCLPLECPLAFGISPLGITPPENIPRDLLPTPLQQSTDHPYWIKTLPFPALRDSLILLTEQYSSQDFCFDLGQGLYEGFDDVERRGLLVWGNPWSRLEWEFSEGFLRKWGFLLKGCSNIIETTNYWRELRGEEALPIDILDY